MATKVRNVLCFGDSIAKGVDVGAGEGWAALLADRFSAANSEVIPARPFFYDLNVPGATVESITQRVAYEVPPRMRPGRPNLTILSFGNNDAWEDTDNGVRATAPLEFSRQTQRLASLLMEHGDVLYVGFPRCDEEKVDHYRGKNIKLVNDALYLYEEMACQAVLAAARRMRGRAAAVPLHAMSWDNPKCTLGPDGLHPSPEGHRAIAETIAPVFDDMLGHLS